MALKLDTVVVRVKRVDERSFSPMRACGLHLNILTSLRGSPAHLLQNLL
jgi:hypothetical protein